MHKIIIKANTNKIDTQELHDDDTLTEIILKDENDVARIYAVKINNSTAHNQEQGNIMTIHIANISEWIQYSFLNDIRVIEARVIKSLVRINNLQFKHAVITEIYAPGCGKYRSPQKDKGQINITAQLLSKLGFSSEEIGFSSKENRLLLTDASLYTSFISGIKHKVDTILKEIAPLIF